MVSTLLSDSIAPATRRARVAARRPRIGGPAGVAMTSECRAEIDAACTELVSSANHEFRTPLSSIVGYVEVLLDGDAGPVNDVQREMLSTVASNARALARLVEELVGNTSTSLTGEGRRRVG